MLLADPDAIAGDRSASANRASFDVAAVMVHLAGQDTAVVTPVLRSVKSRFVTVPDRPAGPALDNDRSVHTSVRESHLEFAVGARRHALGVVDVKVAAIDNDWSGQRVVWRVANRRQP